MKIKAGRRIIKICECCKTNKTKSKQGKYCKPCSEFIVLLIHKKISNFCSQIEFLKELLEDIKDGNSISY